MKNTCIEFCGILDSYIFQSRVEERLRTKSTLYSVWTCQLAVTLQLKGLILVFIKSFATFLKRSLNTVFLQNKDHFLESCIVFSKLIVSIPNSVYQFNFIGSANMNCGQKIKFS